MYSAIITQVQQRQNIIIRYFYIYIVLISLHTLTHTESMRVNLYLSLFPINKKKDCLFRNMSQNHENLYFCSVEEDVNYISCLTETLSILNKKMVNAASYCLGFVS